MWLIHWFEQQAIAAWWIFVGLVMIGAGLFIGDLIGGIGDKLFGRKPNDHF